MPTTIYLDHAATTPILPEVAKAIHACHREGLGNPASAHAEGRRARALLEDAREGIAEFLGLDLRARPADRLIFTSGGTEANNLALAGLARMRGTGRIAVSTIEHPSVRAAAERRAAEGGELTWLRVTADGVVDLEEAGARLTNGTALASVQWCNHETGAVQPVTELAALCRARSIVLHTDAAQALGKLPVDFRAAGVDALSLAGHKLRGPVGIGALALRGGVALRPLLVGGAQQLGERAGTEDAALAVGLWEACRRARREFAERQALLRELQSCFEAELRAATPQAVVLAAGAPRSPHISMIAFPGLPRESLLVALDLAGVACSAGSACASGSSKASPTLRAMGLPDELLRSALRFSFGSTTRLADVVEAAQRISLVVKQLRSGNNEDAGPRPHRVSG